MIIDVCSDLHGYYPELQGGDLLIVAGDLTARDLPHERYRFLQWLAEQEYRKKIWIAGNHDNSLVGMKFTPQRPDAAEYLCDSGTEFEGFKVWGSPWTKTFEGMNPHCKAFTVATEEELASKFSLIPDDIDILITHSPAKGMLDKTINGYDAGSQSLTNRIHHMQPLLHVFGHIHEAYGRDNCFIPATKYIGTVDCCFVNASHVNEHYQPVNKPIRIIL